MVLFIKNKEKFMTAIIGISVENRREEAQKASRHTDRIRVLYQNQNRTSSNGRI